MIVTAPPRPPHPPDRTERNELEALIEEARRRAQRRRRIYGSVAALAALAGVVAFTLFERTAQSQSSSAALASRPALLAGSERSTIAFIIAPQLHGGPGGALYLTSPDESGQRLVRRNVWREVAWSPDGQRLVFGRDSGIYAVNADGSGERRLTRSGGAPAWSPDGRKIAFTKFTRKSTSTPNGRRISESNEVHVMNADGSGLRRLTSGRDDLLLPWLPDGRIAFLRHTESRAPSGSRAGAPRSHTFELHVINANGTRQRNLTREWGLDGLLEPDLSWSPDGRKIAFTSGARDGNVGLYVLNADGSGQRRLTRSVGLYVNADSSGRRRLTRPAGLGSITWSPDSRTIAFVRERQRQLRRLYYSEIYVINADGSGQRRLTQRGANPRWSPDGERIAYRSSRDGNIELYVMNTDGSEQRRLTQATQDGATVQFHFAWSPAQKR